MTNPTPEEEFIQGVQDAVYRRTRKHAWLDEIEEDFLPLLAKFREAVSG